MVRPVPVIEVLAAFIGNMVKVVVATPKNERQQSVNRASTERQQSINRVSTECQQSVNRESTIFGRQLVRDLLAITQIERTGSLYTQNRQRHSKSHSLKQSVNRASTILCVASLVIYGLCTAYTHNRGIGRLYWQYGWRRCRYT